MLELLVAEAHQRFQRRLVAEEMLPADLEHLGVDEALDQPEHVGIRAPLHLAQEYALAVLEKRQLMRKRERVRQELLGAQEVAPAKDIAIDVPARTLGSGDRAGVAVMGRLDGSCRC